MALALYSDTYWYPNGTLSANVAARVFQLHSPTLIPLWSNSAGTLPLGNPTSTNASGVLTFWAEQGEYWVYINRLPFKINVGLTQEQADLSTGTASGGEFVVNALNPMLLDISPLVGYVVTHSPTNAEPVISTVKSPQRTEALIGPSLTRVLTWWLMDANANIVQQGAPPTPEQRRSLLELGLTAFDGTTMFVYDQTLPVYLNQPLNQLADLMDTLGPFNASGNLISAIPGTMSFSKTAGTIFSRSFNYIPNPNNPHISNVVAQNPVDFQYNTRNQFSESPPPLFNMIDPTNFDSNGTVTPVPNPTDWTIQRVWGYPLNDIAQQVRVQYGQDVFPTMADATDAIGNVDFIPNPEASQFGVLLAHIVVRADATSLTDPTQAFIQRAGKFQAP